MARRFLLLFFLHFGIGCFGWAQARTVPNKPGNGPGNTTSVTIGQSSARLYGPWKFTVGDSPIDPLTHEQLWAEPGFDDSGWETVNLTSAEGAIDPTTGLSGYVPGWTAKGHPGYWGYAWYRIRLRANVKPGEKLAVGGPSDVDDAYQLMANGVVLGSFGDFSRSRPTIYNTRPMIFQLPQQDGEGPASVVLAFRFWMEPTTAMQQPDAGGMHNAPLLGDAGTVAAAYQSQWVELSRAYATTPIFAFLYLLLALTAFSLVFFDRSDRVYLWIGGVYLLAATSSIVLILTVWTQALSGEAGNVITDILLTPLTSAGWAMIWWVWFRLRRPAWLPGAAFGLAALLALSNSLGENLWFTLVPGPVSAPFHVISMAARLATLALLLWIFVEGIRTQGVEGWVALPALLLHGMSRFQNELSLLHLQIYWFPFGVQFGVGQLAGLLLLQVLVLLLGRRLYFSVLKQRRMALDVKQAQEVQQVILPRARVSLPGFEVESEYRPAMEVGGDFFQIVPHPSDGSLLIVAGDVSGKGLKAGMIVALLVGATRTAAETNPEPVFVLGALNRRLLGRGDAQATCLALCIARDGAVTLANAGHMPPYLNGEQVAMEGALPLGMLPGADFSVMHFNLAEGDRLVLVSDGIAEATDAEGRLFGFDRAEQLLKTGLSAADLATAAQRFGQADDISVIAVTKIAATTNAAREPVPEWSI